MNFPQLGFLSPLLIVGVKAGLAHFWAPRLRFTSEHDASLSPNHGPAANAAFNTAPSDPGQGTISSAKYHQKYPPT
jgi:hypothetical protein